MSIVSVVILAAGKGSRMRSKMPKVLHELAGKALLGHVLETAKALEPADLWVVTGYGGSVVDSYCRALNVKTVNQPEQLGTGDAVSCALTQLQGDMVLVLYGDVPLIEGRTLEELIAATKGSGLALLSVNLDDPTGYGRILKSDSGVTSAIREERDASDEERSITECNTGILACSKELLTSLLSQVECSNSQGEFYLTDIVELAVAQGVLVETVCTDNMHEVEGINSKQQLERVERDLQLRKAEELMEQGVTIRDRSRIDIRGKLTVGLDSEIDVNCIFEGNVTLGNNVKIASNVVIRDSVLGDNVTILDHSLLDGANIGKSAVVGPFARLRPGTRLEEGSKVGNFVETKNSLIGAGSKVSHLSYLGDCTLGERVNIGAGTITCNYDGVSKHNTFIGDDCFVGSNSALVAPLSIGDGATIGAGSVLTKDAASHKLTLTRAKQITLPAWTRPSKNGK